MRPAISGLVLAGVVVGVLDCTGAGLSGVAGIRCEHQILTQT